VLGDYREHFLVKADRKNFLDSVGFGSGVMEADSRVMWKWVRKSNVTRSVCGITEDQSRTQLQTVTNDPMWGSV
jgi:hypothetical protein